MRAISSPAARSPAPNPRAPAVCWSSLAAAASRYACRPARPADSSRMTTRSSFAPARIEPVLSALALVTVAAWYGAAERRSLLSAGRRARRGFFDAGLLRELDVEHGNADQPMHGRAA